MTDPNNPTIQQLVGDVMRDGVDLARKEFALFRTEMAANAGAMAKGVAMFAVAAVFAVASLIWLTQALVYGIDVVVHSYWISALIVGGLLALVAGVFVIVGKNLVSAATLTPSRTVTSLKRDGEILSERAV